MLRKLKNFLFILAVASAAVWIVGLLTGTVVPIFGGIRAVKIGAVCFSVSLSAEIAMYLFAWLGRRQFWDQGNKRKPFPIVKKYGNRK